MLSEFDSLVKKKRELQEWWKLGSTIAKYNNATYKLHGYVNSIHSLDFCGQKYAGDNNYHESPKFFLDSVIKEINDNLNTLVKSAYEKEIARLDAEIEKHRQAVLEVLNHE